MDATYFLLLSSLGLVITTQAQDCTRPIAGDNMNLKDAYILLDTFPNGTKVSFACAVGYTAAGGSPSITCTAGSWSPVRLKCERRNCGAAEEVPNGYVDYPQGTEFGDELLVTCNTGFRLVGRNNKRLCGAQGWMGRMPECEAVTCDPPPPIQSGIFRPDEVVYQYGEVVEYSCQQDYTLSGSRTISCSADGVFEPSPPTCIKVHCEEPVIANADWIGGSRPPHRYQSTVTYQCRSGYTMIGESTLTCGIDSQWSPGLPTCQRLTTPKTTTTTTTTTTPLDTQCEEPVIANADWIGGSRPPHKYRSMVTYQCRSGYIMIGEPTLTCGIDSQWSPGLPTCQLRGCEEPRITNAERIGGTKPPYGYQSLVTYQCKSGYKMIGEPTLTCGRDGQWSPGLPKCQADSDTTGNNGNSLALGLGIGLPLIVVLVFCGWYFCGFPCIKTKRGNHRGPAGPMLVGLKNVG